MNLLKKYWPVFIITAVWLIFSYPYFLLEKVPFPSGYLVNFFAPWNAVSDFAGPFKNGAMPDVITQIYPWKSLVINSLKQGVIPLWNPYSFSGTPLLANYQSAVFTPLNVLYFTLPFIDAWSLSVLFQPLLAGLFTYLYVRTLKLNEFSSLASSFAFMFCGFITTWMSYQTLGFAILFLPLALFSIEKFYETRKWQYKLILTVTVPLSFFSGHFQTSLYFLIFITFYLLFKLYSTRDIKPTIVSLLSMVFGLLIAGPQILPSIELYQNSVRSQIFSVVEIIPWIYLPTFIAPDFFGNPVTRNNWLGHYAEWNGYIGLIPLMLGFYSLNFNKSRKYILFFFVMVLGSVLLAFKSPLLDLVVSLKIPVISTSAASRIIVVASFAFSILSGFGFEKLTEDIKRRNFKPMFFWFFIFGSLLLLLWVEAVLTFFIPEDKAPIALSNLRLPTILFGAFLAVSILGILMKNKKNFHLFSILIILIISIDLLRFAIKWQPFESRKFVYPYVPVSNFFKEINPYDRILGNFGAEVSNTYRASYIEGYDPLYISRYGEFLSAASDGKLHDAQRSGVVFPKKGERTQDILNFLGVKYIIHKIADGRYSWAYPFWEYPVDYFTPVYKDAYYEVYQNQKAFNRVLIIGDYRIEKSNQELIGKMFGKGTNLKDEAFLEENIGKLSQNPQGEASIKLYKQNEIIIEASSSGKSLLVLTDPYYPGWKAYIDNSSARIYRTDYAFRGIVIPQGKHVIKLIYAPESLRTGLLFSLLGLSGAGGAALFLRKR